ncbi:hypothetical protein B0T24DRAFT_635989 [Lasiosphaeria ovina]|uniref:Transcription factor TFIIIC triple barrel domain-containing protein n=1 Tax=Lasiosphaeria ovina TaxID=92902 RepID=A0AAE0N0C1_9PEZI|nr:hypothetical protein B0T24DRAFT_635989 [Lasiosphaeria ovina]
MASDSRLRQTPSVQEENEDEWEYEYSTTETETYYLTLDLSVRDFLERRKGTVVQTRGGYRVWYNPLFNAPEPRATNPELITNNQDGDDGELPEHGLPDLDNIGLAPSDARSELPIDPLLQGQPGGNIYRPDKPNDDPVDEIQILDLHSAEPIISYRNHVFRGSWVENIGTEMIFTPHEDNPALPLLRRLNQNIDLLAASASRINFKEAILVPKNVGVSREQEPAREEYERDEDIPERYRQNGGIYVHIGGDKSGQRQPQAHFLEDLITLKRKRGEKDEVTIQSVETRQNRLMVEDEEEERRRNKLRADHMRMLAFRERKKDETGAAIGAATGAVASAAPAAEGSYIPRQKAMKGRRGPGSRPRTRRAVLIRRDSVTGDHRSPSTARVDESTPTPARWSDLPRAEAAVREPDGVSDREGSLG